MSLMRRNFVDQSGGAVEILLGSVALVIAVVALVVALTRGSAGDKSAASLSVTSTTVSPARLCQEKLTSVNSRLKFLFGQQVALRTQEQQVNAQLTAELAAHSPNAGATDAAHQAVLREQADIQQRILRLSESRSCSTTP